MEREIKLRAWDHFNEEMVYSNEEDSRFLCKDGKWSVRYAREKTITKNDIEQDVPVWHESEEIELMLYVGTKDVDGKEIYEGDIYRLEEETDEGDIRTYFISHYVKEWGMFAWLSSEEYNKYIEDGFEALDEPMYWTYPIEPKEGQTIKLCGNIYENPELLKSATNV